MRKVQIYPLAASDSSVPKMFAQGERVCMCDDLKKAESQCRFRKKGTDKRFDKNTLQGNTPNNSSRV